MNTPQTYWHPGLPHHSESPRHGSRLQVHVQTNLYRCCFIDTVGLYSAVENEIKTFAGKRMEPGAVAINKVSRKVPRVPSHGQNLDFCKCDMKEEGARHQKEVGGKRVLELCDINRRDCVGGGRGPARGMGAGEQRGTPGQPVCVFVTMKSDAPCALRSRLCRHENNAHVLYLNKTSDLLLSPPPAPPSPP